MSQITNNNNLNAHYSSNTKAKRPTNTIANAPKALLNNKTPYNDKEATKRMQQINDNIYNDYKTEKQRNASNAIKFISGSVLAILGALGIKKFFFKKS